MLLLIHLYIVSNQLVPLLTTTTTTTTTTGDGHIKYCIRLINDYKNAGVEVVFVLDGRPMVAKGKYTYVYIYICVFFCFALHFLLIISFVFRSYFLKQDPCQAMSNVIKIPSNGNTTT